MKRVHASGEVVFRPSMARASWPLAGSALLVPLLTGVLVWAGVLEAWTVATAIAGAFLLFCTSFLMPILMSVRVKPGEISGPAPGGGGIHTLRLDRLDLGRTHCDPDSGLVCLVDALGSRLELSPLHLPADEIHEALVIFGLDPRAIIRVTLAP